jgi:hypothetical protein
MFQSSSSNNLYKSSGNETTDECLLTRNKALIYNILLWILASQTLLEFLHSAGK